MADRLTPILDAIAAKVTAAGFALGGTTLPVLKRKAAVRRQTLDPRAMITIAKSATAEDTTRRRVDLWQTAYVIDVIVNVPYSGPDDDIDEYATIRDSLVDLLKRPPLAGAPEVFDMDASPADWLRPLGETTDFDWFAVQVTAIVAHP